MAFRQLILAAALLLLSTNVSSQRRVAIRKGQILTTTPKPKTIVDKISDVQKRIASVSATTSDFQMQVQSMFGWEKLLSPAPLSIAVLGELILVASNTLDFRLDEMSPEGGFKFMKYPGSFRASLTQITNGGYVAFNTAHHNMDKIRLLLSDVPNQIKKATRYILSKNPEVIEGLLPIPLNNVRQVSTECVQLSSRIVNSFEFVMNLTAEVLEACVGTKGVKEQQLAATRQDLEVASKNLEFFQANTKETLNWQAKYEKQVEVWDSKLKLALENLPKAEEILAINFLEGIGNLLTLQFGKIFIIDQADDNSRNSQNNSTANADAGNANAIKDFDPCLVTLKDKLAEAMSLVTQFHNMASKKFAKISRASTGLYKPKKALKQLDKLLDETEECAQLSNVCSSLKDSLIELGEVAGNVTNTTDFSTLIDTAEELYTTTAQMKSFVGLQSTVVPPRTPKIEMGRSVTEMAVKSAINNMQTAQETLSFYEKASKKIRSELKDTNNQYIAALEKMQKLRIEEISYDEAIQLLGEGLKLLGGLRKHWGKLVQFFQTIENIIDLIVGKSLNGFLQEIDTVKTRVSLIDYSLDVIYMSVLKSGQAAHVAQKIAEMYLNVSNNYVMENILKLNGLMAIGGKNPTEIQVKRTELIKQCELDSEAIINFVMDKRDKLKDSLMERRNEIVQEYAPIFEEVQASGLLTDESQEENSLANYDDDNNLTNEIEFSTVP